MKDFIAIDFETANPKRVSACAIGYARVSNGDIVESKGYLIKPVGGHAPFQSKIHGIKEEHTCSQPEFCALYPIIAGIFDSPLVAHSLFDEQVLRALARYFGIAINFIYHDTSSMAKMRLPDLKNHKLKTLVKYFKLPTFKHHDAKEDAIACARVYLKLQDLDQDNPVQIAGDSKTEFKGLISDILEDDVVDYKEAYQLLYWLEDHRDIAKEYEELTETTRRFLQDDVLDNIEAKALRMMLLYIRDKIF
ncbi:MAG: exonuclease domain-containing protein [Candidatus Krumholzibacteriota bacterium]|nr:exonuclease domain-containing protein [Candidatus Krumholzibacteriota bacterium]